MSEAGRDDVLGEGDYDAARRYREHTERFVKMHAGDAEAIRQAEAAADAERDRTRLTPD